MSSGYGSTISHCAVSCTPGRSTQHISLTPSITIRDWPHNFGIMEGSDPHASSSSTPVPSLTPVSESNTAAIGVPSITRRGGRASSFSIKKAGAGLGSIYVKTVPSRLLSPRSIADQIRQLCRHDETTVCQRSMVPAEHVSDADKETLKLLCKKLLLSSLRR